MNFRLTISLLFTGSILFSSCNESPESEVGAPPIDEPSEYPIISVDMAHNQGAALPEEDPQTYSVPPTMGLVVDTSQLQPRLSGENKDLTCNSIQIIQAGKGQFSAVFDPLKEQHSIDSSTLSPNPGSGEFEGFATGDTCILGIGHYKESPGEQPAFHVAWATIIQFE